MRRAYVHRRGAVMLGGAPVGSDVPGCIQVRVLGVRALLAHEALAARSVSPRHVTARRAPLRGVACVHEHHPDSTLGRLVRQHLLLTAERPGVQPTTRVLVEAPTSHADVRQVLERKGGACGAGSENLRSDVVIAPGAKPRPLPRALLREALGGLGAFGLEATLSTEVAAVDVMPRRVAEERSVGQHGRDHDAPIATDDRRRNLGFRDLLGEGEG